jgi:hypothetical protein
MSCSRSSADPEQGTRKDNGTIGEKILVDGANVAFVELSATDKPKVSNLVAVRRALEERGYEPIIIADASLRHEVDDPRQWEALVDEQDIRQAPAGTDADYFILETANRYDARVVSNDEFESYRDEYPWIEERRVPLMIINGHVQFYQGRLEKSGS